MCKEILNRLKIIKISLDLNEKKIIESQIIKIKELTTESAIEKIILAINNQDFFLAKKYLTHYIIKQSIFLRYKNYKKKELKTGIKKRYEKNYINSDELYFSTTTMAKKYFISARPTIFLKLIDLEYIYKNENGKYILTKDGEDLGGKYEKNIRGQEYIVWAENSGINEIIKLVKKENK